MQSQKDYYKKIRILMEIQQSANQVESNNKVDPKNLHKNPKQKKHNLNRRQRQRNKQHQNRRQNKRHVQYQIFDQDLDHDLDQLQSEYQNMNMNRYQLRATSPDDTNDEREILAHITQSLVTNLIIRDGAIIVKYFHDSSFVFTQYIPPSKWTYWGALESLVNLYNRLNMANIDYHNICVIGPQYTYKGGIDVQPCGGGKATRWFDADTNSVMHETFEEAARNELLEELRIFSEPDQINVESDHEFVMSEFVSHGPTQKKGHTDVCTKIYSYQANMCTTLTNYDAREFSRKNRRGVDDFASRVGYIVWGTAAECFNLVDSIETDSSGSPLIDHISGVAIIPLIQAINMVIYATHHLNGSLVSGTVF